MAADMTNIVITGSSRGLGKQLAKDFLKRGCSVVVSGSTQGTTDPAVAELSQGLPAGVRVVGIACDVRQAGEVQALWDGAVADLGSVDIWLNNAGLGAYIAPFSEVGIDEITDIVDVNMRGAMYGCRVAIRGMQAQGGGHIYNVEGYGSNDEMGQPMTTYATTKRGLRYLGKSLAKELKGGSVKISAIYPGILPTDHNMRQKERMSAEEWKKTTGILNILGDRTDTVTPWIVERVLANDKNGACLNWLTRRKVLLRFLGAGFRKRKIFG
jgi:NAD(P)-dependent dehydrogenase (short-subunit alcohol dehydrogenase family)